MYQNNNNLSRNLVYVEEVFKFLENEDCEVYVSSEKDFEFLSALEVLAGRPLNVVFYEEDPCCPFCNSESNKNGRRVRYINMNRPVKIQKYVCSDENCGKFHETSLEKIVPKNCNYAYKLRFEVIEQLLIDYSSLDKISEQINRIYGCKPSRQTVLNHQKESHENYYKDKIEKALKYTDNDLSGVYGYDEQFLKVNGETRARLSLLDLNTHIQLNQLIVEEFDVKITEMFIKNTLKNKNVDTMVTDGFTGYNHIIEDLKAKHQLCTFHIMHNLIMDLVKKLNKIKRQIKTRKKKTQNLTRNLEENRYKKNKKDKIKQLKLLKREIRNLKKEIKEWESYVERISGIFKAKTVKSAKMRFNRLFNSRGHLTPLIGDFIQKLSKVFDKTINHIANNRIPSTNNKKERHFGITLPGYLKRRFRTDLGLENALKIRRIPMDPKKQKKSVTF